MSALRALIRDHRTLALFVAMLALCVKFVVPQGYMLGATSYKYLTVQLCFDGIEHRTATVAIPMDSKKQPGDDDRTKGPTDKCAYGSLSMGALAAVHGPLLALALAFVMALGFAAVRQASWGRVAYLRPPLRGPPALI